MKRNLFLSVLFLLFLSSLLHGESEKKAGVFIELDQMLTLKVGVEYRFSEDWGIRGALGSGIPPLGTFTWNMLGYYRFTNRETPWKIDLEFGVSQAYFNFLEGQTENAPFHGYISGLSVRAGRKTAIGLFALRIGGGIWIEHQKIPGWKDPRFMPVVTLIYGFEYPD